MKLLEWLPTLLWMLAAGASSALWFYRTGKHVGHHEARTTDQIRHSTDDVSEITHTVRRELKRVEAQGETKADVKALIALEDRLNLRLTYLDGRLHETITRYDKRFDDGSVRMSKISAQVTEMVDQVRTELMLIRERLTRVEEHQRVKEHRA